MESGLDFLIGAAMFTLMFAMGLALTPDDFRRIAAAPRATIVGTMAQLIVMPVVGLGLSRMLGLSPLLSTGLIVVSACPGGMFSNMYVHLARGNTALSITLTATATLATLFTLPLWVRYSLVSFSPDGVSSVEMPVLETALRLGGLTVLPVAIGMWARSKRPELAAWERRISVASAGLIVIGAVSEATSRPTPATETFVDATAAAGIFALAAMAVGLLLPIFFRLPARDTVTIAVELIVKNTLLGIVLVSQALEFEALLPIFAFAIFQTPGGIALLVGWRALERHGLVAKIVEDGSQPAA